MRSFFQQNKRWFVAGGVLSACLIAWGVSALWRASRALDQAAEERRQESTYRFDARPLTVAARSGFEYLGTPASWRDAVVFQDRLYLCGSSGLYVYDSDGKLQERFRVGERLPAAPLVALATGLTSASQGPELWIATAGEGLIAYDGRAFRHIRPASPDHRKLTAVLPLQSGRLLLGTEKAGLLVYDGRTLAAFHERLRAFHVTALAGDENGIWVGTIDRGLLHWHGGQLDVYDTSKGMPDARVLSVAVHEGRTYAGTAVGIARIENGRVERVLGEGIFARTLHATGARLLAGTHEEGLYEFPVDGSRRRPSRVADVRGSIERILELRGATYALTPDGLYDIRTWNRVIAQEPAPLADSNIAALAAPTDGRLWVGYFDRGLDLLEPDAVRVRHLEDEHLFCVNRIVAAPEQRGWAVATANGLVLLDDRAQKRNVVGRAQGLLANHVTDVALLGESMVVATPAGLTFLDREGARSLYAFHGLVNNHVYALGVSGGRVLAGTLGGLTVLEGDVVRAGYTTANSPLRHNWVSAIVPVGRDWFIGTYGSGVYRLDAGGVWHTFSDMPTGIEINPNAMLASSGRVYAGSLGRGLLVYDADRNRWRSVIHGLPSPNVTALAGRGGFLYVGTDNGLVRIQESEL